MSIDWDLAVKIAGGGFGMVFLILAILALVVWATGLVWQRTKSKQKSDAGEEKGN